MATDAWPEPPPPPIARECRYSECFVGDRLIGGLFSPVVLHGRVAEIHFRRAGLDDGEPFPLERISFRPADARELLQDLTKVVAELDEAGPSAPADDPAQKDS